MRFVAICCSSIVVATALLAGCSEPSAPSPQGTRPGKPGYDLVAAIRAAGAKEKSVIDVSPLRDPGVAALQDGALADERAGHYQDAADKLDQAIKLSPDSPDLLQDRAEAAVYLRDFADAEKLAKHSWDLGPKLGSLCARNWQTIVEVKLQAGDEAGATSARKWVLQCHVAGAPRY